MLLNAQKNNEGLQFKKCETADKQPVIIGYAFCTHRIVLGVRKRTMWLSNYFASVNNEWEKFECGEQNCAKP